MPQTIWHLDTSSMPGPLRPDSPFSVQLAAFANFPGTRRIHCGISVQLASPTDRAVNGILEHRDGAESTEWSSIGLPSAQFVTMTHSPPRQLELNLLSRNRFKADLMDYRQVASSDVVYGYPLIGGVS
jgi:hypothetical protein